MQRVDFDLTATDGHRISAYRWKSRERPRGALILAHGMGEHARRYAAALEPIVARRFDVYGLDHRGHGAGALAANQLGNFGPGGFGALAGDLVTLIGVANSDNPGVPLVLYGHSMGSMVAQLFAVQHSELIDGLALSGSAAVDHIEAAARNPGLLNASFEPARTPFDWLSRSEQVVDAYMADPLCAFALTAESFGSMLQFGSMLADPANLATIRKALPIYLFSGDRDPLHHQFNALQPVIDRYRAAGLEVTVDLYPNARHEILNETNRAEVIAALLTWLERVAP